LDILNSRFLCVSALVAWYGPIKYLRDEGQFRLQRRAFRF
jgi:hypothetical protein